MLTPEEREARIAELIENLFNLDRDRTGELLALLALCTASQVARIFGCLPDEAPATTDPSCRPDEPEVGRKHRPWVWTRYWEYSPR
jgi:hypothetical protein